MPSQTVEEIRNSLLADIRAAEKDHDATRAESLRKTVAHIDEFGELPVDPKAKPPVELLGPAGREMIPAHAVDAALASGQFRPIPKTDEE